ncbi:DNA gyrase subunit A [Desulfococcaceae bacterium HSG8]|nr:DNA gyrase subunit A [Desulfococcaceae bacterium HSG8]
MMQTERMPEISIESEMKKSYLDYAMSVIIGRALPDVRDGLKPVHRRVLFVMHELKNDWNKPYKKSARVVGDSIGKFHPHGDTAVYDTIVRMAQSFSLRYPLVDGQGNFGSVDGDPPAAMRYTEVRMSKIAHEMLADLEKETVDFVPNYDESLTEPTVLPAKIPNLLINGSSGIAVGMATNIPPHNISEVIEAIKAVIDNPDISARELIQIIPGPDFPTAAMIYGTKGIREAYETGRGIIRLRARATVEEDKKGNSETIAVTEIPYQVNKAKLIEKISELMKAKQIEGIKYVRDESDRHGMRIAVGLKRDQVGEVILNQLYKHTQMENSFGIIFLAIVDNRPQLFSLKEILEHFILHRKEIITRRTQYDLKKAEDRAHILEGLKIALENLDDIVALIRGSKTAKEAKENLQNFKARNLTPVQAQAILDMRMQRLTGLEQEKIAEEYENVLKDIAGYKDILGSNRMVLDIIKEELAGIQEEFGDSRLTEIVESAKELTMEDMIAEEDMVVTISKSGYIKRTPISLYQSQRRGGKGKTAMGTKDEDFVERLFVASTHHTFLFFTNQGKVYWCKVYEIPQSGRASRGKAIVNLLNFEQDERLTTVLNVPAFEPGYHIIMATRNGLVKKTDLMAYSRPLAGGIIALRLVSGDELIVARITDGTMNVFLGSLMGKSTRFHESDARPMGRATKGVRGMKLASGDHIVGMEVLSHGQTLFTATENGYGKRTSIDEYPLRKRGGKGVITIKTSERNGMVVSILLVEEDDDLMLMTDSGRLIRTPVSGIKVISRNTQGVKLMGLEPGEKIIGAVRLPENEEEKDESAQPDSEDDVEKDESAQSDSEDDVEKDESAQSDSEDDVEKDESAQSDSEEDLDESDSGSEE